MTIQEIARALVASGKGIFASDESPNTMGARFASCGIENTPEHRRAYREALFGSPGISEYISGVIMHEETIVSTTEDGTVFPKALRAFGVLPGVKVDMGTEPLSADSPEKHTLGLDTLAERLPAYVSAGAVFAKWRAVFSVGDGMPSEACIQKNADELAEYAKRCQDMHIMPIVEPEVLMDGTHSMAQCAEATERVLKGVYTALTKRHVALDGMLLKSNMVVPGNASGESVSSEQVAHETVRVLLSTAPAQVPGVVFLSGGQSELEATNNLNEMYLLGETVPWKLSFSYGRALQDSAMRAWSAGNIEQAQQIFLHRAEMNSLASMGEYEFELEGVD